jgi:hypothetical protein
VTDLLASQGGVFVTILASTGMIVWLDARTRRAFRSMTASLVRIDARLGIIEARFAALDAKKNGGDHVAVDHPQLIEHHALRK